MQRLTILLLFLSTFHSYAQLTGSQLLDKAIQYHDPQGNWETFDGVLFVTMSMEKGIPVRDSEIHINIPKEYFYLKAIQPDTETEYTVNKGKCTYKQFKRRPEGDTKEENESCDRAMLYKNYYTYLYGLPMKLKDEGTFIDQKVERKTFKEKEYLVLKVTYDQEVGKDTWFFYFDPKTYAMEVYQFLKDSKPNTGEYILLSGMETINGIKMPKTRDWYYNKNDKFLGTDVLKVEK